MSSIVVNKTARSALIHVLFFKTNTAYGKIPRGFSDLFIIHVTVCIGQS